MHPTFQVTLMLRLAFVLGLVSYVGLWRPRHTPCLGSFILDSGGNVSDLVVTRNCCMARMLPGEADLVSE